MWGEHQTIVAIQPLFVASNTPWFDVAGNQEFAI